VKWVRAFHPTHDDALSPADKPAARAAVGICWLHSLMHFSGGKTPKLPLPLVGSGPPYNTWILGPTQVFITNCMSIGSSVLLQLNTDSLHTSQRYPAVFFWGFSISDITLNNWIHQTIYKQSLKFTQISNAATKSLNSKIRCFTSKIQITMKVS